MLKDVVEELKRLNLARESEGRDLHLL